MTFEILNQLNYFSLEIDEGKLYFTMKLPQKFLCHQKKEYSIFTHLLMNV